MIANSFRSTLLVAAATLVATVGSAAAGSAKHYDPDTRADVLSTVIEEGRRSGQITYFEGRKLRKAQDEVARLQHLAEADGRITKAERVQIKAAQDALAEQIYAERTDGWKRWSLLPRVGR